MRRNIWFITAGLLFLITNSCKKSAEELGVPESTASLTLVNLISSSNGIITNFSNSEQKTETTPLQYYGTAAEIGYGSFEEFPSYTGAQPLAIVSATDTLQTEWSGSLNLAVGSIQSLYFYGSDTSNIDTLLTMDNLPNYPTGDSVTGVRFIHIALQQGTISIDIQGSTGSPVIGSLPYKGVSGFYTLPFTSSNPASGQYVFEFRDATSDSLLATYAYSPIEYKNVSVVLSTVNQNGVSSFTTAQVNDY